MTRYLRLPNLALPETPVTKVSKKMETVEISKKTGYVLLNVMSDWLEYVEDLNAKTRQEIVALDELIAALDANDWFDNLSEQKAIDARLMQQKWQAEKAAAEKAGK